MPRFPKRIRLKDKGPKDKGPKDKRRPLRRVAQSGVAEPQSSARPVSQQDLDDNLDWVRSIAGSIMKQMDLPAQEYDELVSAGYLGFVEASERFDTSQGRTLQQYASLRVRGAIIDAIRKNCDLSARGYRYAKALEAASDVRESQELERQDHESRQASLARALDYVAKGAIAFRLSLDDADFAIELPDRKLNPEEALDKKRTHRLLKRLVEELEEPERSVVQGYYFESKNFPQIAEENGWTKSWVSKIHRRAMDRLQRLIEAEEEERPVGEASTDALSRASLL